ncbi:MAG: NINE protein [Clostridiales bacterium]|nr:NINE protein [Clostridiales bacterium]
MRCVLHQQYEAAGTCAICGRDFCESCLVEVNGRHYCKEHVQDLVRKSIPVAEVVRDTVPRAPHGSYYNSPPPRAPEYGRYYNSPPPPPLPSAPHAPEYGNYYTSPPPPPPATLYNHEVTVHNHYSYAVGRSYGISPKSRLAALLLCGLFGVAGFHRFYSGKIGTGLLWLFTGGMFGIGYIVDLIMIATGTFRDDHGELIQQW